MLRSVFFYLLRTKDWGLRYYRSRPDPYFPSGDFDNAPPPLPSDFPSFPQASSGTELYGLVDAAYANDLRQRRSTTGFALILNGAAIVYKSSTQTTTALSATEAEFYAAVAAAKAVIFV